MHQLRKFGHFLHALGLKGGGAVVGAGEGIGGALGCWKGRGVQRPGSSAGAADVGTLLDFVYSLDGWEAQSVAEALAAWWPRLRDGGVLAGGAYYDGVVQGVASQVKSAVDAFAAAQVDEDHPRGLQVRVTLDAVPSWFVVKGSGSACPRVGRRKIALLTAHDEGQRQVAAVSTPNKAAYCRRHGYDFVCRT